MASQATQVKNVVSKVKDYDVLVSISGSPLSGIEYAGITLPGRATASTYNLITNLRNIQESAGDGEYNALTVQVPMSIAEYKTWHNNYDLSGQIVFRSTLDNTLSAGFNVRVAGLNDWEGAFDAINPMELTFNVLSFMDSKPVTVTPQE